MEFESLCKSVRAHIPGIVKHLQKELQNKVMSVPSEEVEKLRMQYNYLSELERRIENECVNISE